MDIKEIFEVANQKFLEKEIELIKSEVSERSICAALKPFIEKELQKNLIYKDYNVDVEYNRNAGNIKTIINEKEEVISITCDLIVHSRGKLENDNIMALEMKKSYRLKEEKESDRKRLIALTKPKSTNEVWSYDGKTFPKHVCGYSLGIYYEIDIKNNLIIIEYYTNGKMINNFIKKI
ncbi:MAG: hypothetical protein E7F17_13385 [Clostridium perfringens]|uniref:hypothetical protein n=1 Tax=Clostridium perfringens TaxID=1502 RepID=UPI001CB10325|nr:hypothetical protein [Clostridium perfringens]MDU3535598.1 hypothetical protein [Clostridium perfringens]HBI6976413.1 hypothetical protein [Clostridium perfringens]